MEHMLQGSGHLTVKATGRVASLACWLCVLRSSRRVRRRRGAQRAVAGGCANCLPSGGVKWRSACIAPLTLVEQRYRCGGATISAHFPHFPACGLQPPSPALLVCPAQCCSPSPMPRGSRRPRETRQGLPPHQRCLPARPAAPPLPGPLQHACHPGRRSGVQPLT